MSHSIKTLFIGYLSQLDRIVSKIPEYLFNESLASDMFSLEVNSQIAVNFILRGYCPLIGMEVVLCNTSASGKEATLSLISEVMKRLNTYPDFHTFNDTVLLQDKAGFAQITLPQSEYVFKYIIPNFMFHMSMVYATARKRGVNLSKGDFDGLHSYPAGFSFIEVN